MAADGDASGLPRGLRRPHCHTPPGGVKPKVRGKNQAFKEKLIQHTSVTPAAVCNPILAEEPAVSWNNFAKEESFWRKFCEENWPSTGTPEGVALVARAGGYQKLFRCRQTGVATPPKTKPRSWLKMKFLRFLVDVAYKGKSVFSKVVEKPHDFMRNTWFEICIPIPDFHTHTDCIRSLPHWAADELGAVGMGVGAVPALEIVQRSAGGVDEAISKEYLADLKVEWSAVRMRDHKMVCLMSGQPLGRGGALCLPEDDEDHYKVEFEQPLVLEEREQNIVQMTEGELCSFANISVQLVYDDASKLHGRLKVTEVQLGIRLGFNEWATMGKALYCLQHLQWT